MRLYGDMFWSTGTAKLAAAIISCCMAMGLPLRLRPHCGLLLARGALFVTACWTKAWPRPSSSPHIRPVIMLVTLGALMAALAVRERLAWACWQEARRREHASRKPKQA